jgi:phosphoenolpyruvate carboxylase
VSEADKEWFRGCMTELVEETLGQSYRTVIEHDDVFVDFMRRVPSIFVKKVSNVLN